MRSRRLPVELLICTALTASAAVMLAWPIVSYDFWWHLAAGREILASGIPRADIWSHTLRGTPWVDFEWLSQVLLFLTAEHAGLGVLVWLKACLAAGAVFLCWLAAREEGAPAWEASLGGALALSLLRTRAFLRPEAFSLPLFAAFVLIVVRARAKEKPALLWLLPPLTALWVNLHGAFVLGPVLLFLAAAGMALEGKRWRPWLLCAGACAAASLLNPYGIGIYKALLSHLPETGRAASPIEEWRTLGLAELPAFWLLLAASFALLARGLLRRESGAGFWAPVLVPFGAWASTQVRFPAYFALAAVPFALSAAAGIEGPAWSRARKAVPPAALVLMAWMLRPVFARDLSKSVRWVRFPEKACVFMEKHGIGGPLYNDYPFGGYLDWRFRGKPPIFFDGRYIFAELLREDAAARETDLEERRKDPSGEVLNGGASQRFQIFLNGHDVRTALVRQGGADIHAAVRLFPRKKWALVYWDDSSLLYLRRRPRVQAFISKYELPLADPVYWNDTLFRILRSGLPKREVLSQLNAHEKTAGFTAVGAAMRSSLGSVGK